jgi:hypothetical protein
MGSVGVPPNIVRRFKYVGCVWTLAVWWRECQGVETPAPRRIFDLPCATCSSQLLPISWPTPDLQDRQILGETTTFPPSMSDQRAEKASRAETQRAREAKEYEEAMEARNPSPRKVQEKVDKAMEWRAKRKAVREARKSRKAGPVTVAQERFPEKERKGLEQIFSIPVTQDQSSSGSSSPSIYEDALEQLPFESPHFLVPKEHPASEQNRELSQMAPEVVNVEPRLEVDGVDQLHRLAPDYLKQTCHLNISFQSVKMDGSLWMTNLRSFRPSPDVTISSLLPSSNIRSHPTHYTPAPN